LVSCHNLRIEKHFVQDVSSQRRKGYGICGVREVLNQDLMIFRIVGHWKTMGKKSKLLSRADLRHSQSNGSTMMNTVEDGLPSIVWNIAQANHWYGTPSVD
jgi:hypothetical protein